MVKLFEFIVFFAILSGCTIPEKPVNIHEFRIENRNRCVFMSSSELSVTLYKKVSIKEVAACLNSDNGYGSVMYRILKILDRTKRIMNITVYFSRGYRVAILKTEKQVIQALYQLKSKYRFETLAFYDPPTNTIYVSIETLKPSLLAHEFAHMINDRKNRKLNERDEEGSAMMAEINYIRLYGEN